MHANLSVTDGVYVILSQTDIQTQIRSLEKQTDINDSQSMLELVALAKKLEHLLNANKV